MLNQAKLIGVLYLENNLAPHVFVPARIAVLKLLASQAAVSLENTHLYRDLEQREAKIRRLVDANVIGIFIFALDGRIIEANEAFLQMVGYHRKDLISGRLCWTELTPSEWHDHDARAVAEVKLSWRAHPYEKEYIRKDGSRVPVLIGVAMFEENGNEGVAFVLDLTERKRAEAEARESERRYREMQMELAHTNRVATIGQLTASIAHEVNQPITGTIISAQAALRWLDARPPKLEEARQALGRIINDGNRAGEIIGRARGLIKKAPPRQEALSINQAILEVLALLHGEVVKHGISVQPQLADDVPVVHGDRVHVTATSDPQPDHECRPGDEQRQRGPTRPADQHRESRAGWRIRGGAGFGAGAGAGGSRAPVRTLPHDQARRIGAGAVDLPIDHRSARWTIVGDRERAPRRSL